MDRRKAVKLAGAASLTLLAGAGGIAVNSGILGSSSDGNVGKIVPIDNSIASRAVYPDVISPQSSAPPAPLLQWIAPTDSAPVTTTSASASGNDDDHDNDQEQGHEKHDDDKHDDDEKHYEGSDDDD
ncbi:MAG: hypothetical protein R2735_10095 [Microthrixaceae bacterium]